MLSPRTATVLIALTVTGCGAARRGAVSPVVRDIDFEGNGGFVEAYFAGDTRYMLLTQLEQAESRWGVLTPGVSSLIEPALLDQDALARDAWRLEVWYAHHGWLDARAQGWMAVEVRPERWSLRERRLRWAAERGGERAAERLDALEPKLLARRRAQVVDVVGYLEPGPQSTVRTFAWDGMNRNLTTLTSSVRRLGELQEGEPFNLEYAELTRDRLLTLLQDHAFAYARADLSFQAWPEERAVDVRLLVDPGPSAAFGAVSFSGLRHVPEAALREQIGFEEGDTYKISTLRQAQSRLFALGVFALVDVSPDLSDPTADTVPVRVHVAESQPGTFRLGGGLTYTGTHVSPRLTTSLEHLNLGQRLIRGEAEATAGISTRLSDLAQPSAWYPIYGGRLALSYPRWPLPRTQLSGEVAYAQDLQSGQLAYRRPSAALSLSWQARSWLTLRLGGSLEQFSYLNLSGGALRAARLTFGEDFENPYQLTTLDLGLTWDSRDEPLFTRRGVLLEGRLRQAVPAIVGDYAYTDLSVDWRRYLTLIHYLPADGSRLSHALHALVQRRVVAVRTHGRVLVPWGDSALPYPELAFMGGDSSLRGFKPDQVGPYDCMCTYESVGGDGLTGVPGLGQSVTQHFIPHGGTVALGGALEVRHPFVVEGASMVLPFLDVGLLSPSAGEVSLDLVRWGAGVGWRYATPVGPIRFDLATRPLYPEDGRPASSTGCQGTDALARPVDWLSTQANRADPSGRPQWVLIGYLGIGESF
ncbi:MAG: BamA/TamA family outer membrane protein [Deltaproteobacteria bacterium]|nr:BamA/TamA family outer membrane protein [Deltaproteobacteria bacterium]